MTNYQVLVALLLFVTVEQSVSATWNFNNNGGGGGGGGGGGSGSGFFGGQGGDDFAALGDFLRRSGLGGWVGSTSPTIGVFPGWNLDTLKPGKFEKGLKEGFYSTKCPNAETIVRDTVRAHHKKDPTIAAGFLRLFFHDCFIRGCDASILLDKTPSGETTEKFAPANGFTLHGVEVIDAAKAALEAACPGIVSCADILSFATRDASVLAGIQQFPMVAGRRDGKVSLASEVPGKLPDPISTVEKMTQMFNQKGFSQAELVTLLGAHSVGGAHCFTFTNRLYNETDPALEVNLALKLKNACPKTQDPDVTKDAKVDFDPASSLVLDTSFYNHVQTGRGLLTSDNALMNNPATKEMVGKIIADPQKWKREFAQALVKLSKLDVLVGQNGEIRKQCRAVNNAPSKKSQTPSQNFARFPMFGARGF